MQKTMHESTKHQGLNVSIVYLCRKDNKGADARNTDIKWGIFYHLMYWREPSNNAKASDDDEEDALDKEFKVGIPPGRVTCHLLGNFQNIPG